MNIRKMQQLEKLGFDKMWLKDVANNFKPKKHGKYTMKIYWIEDLDQDPETGIYVETACFDNERELSIIHHFFEGQAYVMTVTETGDVIGQGIIDGAPFEEVDEAEGLPYGTWQWLRGVELNSWYQYNSDKSVAMYQPDKVQGIISLLRNRLAEVRTKSFRDDVIGKAIEEELEVLIDTITRCV